MGVHKEGREGKSRGAQVNNSKKHGREADGGAGRYHAARHGGGTGTCACGAPGRTKAAPNAATRG